MCGDTKNRGCQIFYDTGVIKFLGPHLNIRFGEARLVPLSHAIMSESGKHSIEGRRVKQCFYTQGFTMESVTTDKPDA